MNQSELPTLDEFLARGPEKFPRNAYVTEDGFESLYVRWGFHMVDGKMLSCLDLANMTATRPGHGAFKALLKKLRSEQPDLPIYVESVLNEKFMAGLPKHGFTYVPNSYPPSFVLR